jgi:hypothetical protein
MTHLKFYFPSLDYFCILGVVELTSLLCAVTVLYVKVDLTGRVLILDFSTGTLNASGFSSSGMV